MTEEELKNLEITKNVDYLKPENLPTDTKSPVLEQNINDLINLLRTIKRNRTAAPTITPRNFLEQIEFYDDGVNMRLYVWVNKTRGWRYTTLS